MPKRKASKNKEKKRINMTQNTSAKTSSWVVSKRKASKQDMVFNDELESMLTLTQTFSFWDDESDTSYSDRTGLSPKLQREQK